jgi:Tol biopolymer transport system component
MSVLRTFGRARAATTGFTLVAVVAAAACTDTTAPFESTGSHGGDVPGAARPALALGQTPPGLINLCFTCSIVIERDSAGWLSIATMNPDGSGLKKVTYGDRPSWSALHDKIVFTRSHNIYVTNINGTDIKQLTTGGLDQDPSFTPDGHIVFARMVPDSSYATHILLMNGDGTNPRVIVDGPASQWYPRVSPDGKKIAFVADETGMTNVYVQDLTTNVRTPITASVSNPQTSPAWSPDSKRLAYATGTGYSDQCIAIVNADGTGKKFFPSGMAQCRVPSWSPDGKELAFLTPGPSASSGGIQPRLRVARGKVDVASVPALLTPSSQLSSDVFVSWSR